MSRSVARSLLLLALAHAPARAQWDAMGQPIGTVTLPPDPPARSTAVQPVGGCTPPVLFFSGLTWDGSRLWLVDWSNRRAVRLHPETCAPERLIPLPGSYPNGLEWDGSALLFADASAHRIYRLDPANGTVLSSFPTHSDFPIGVTFNGDVWNTASGCEESECTPDVITRQRRTGVHVADFVPPGPFPTGLAFDGVNLWHSDNTTLLIYKIDPASMAVLDSFPAPGPFPNDLAWDGRYLWVAENGFKVLHKYDVGVPTPARRTRWGRLKAIYR